MTQCVVIADEITGGSSVGAMLEKNHCTVCSIMNTRGIKDPATSNFDCMVFSTNSRRLTPEQSYQMVFYAVRLLKSPEVKLYAKRIDPAMRGNTCTETRAMLDALGDDTRIAIVVPAFPALKLSNVGGYMLRDDRPLQKSLESMDDLQPAESGRVADLFIEKFQYKAEALHLKEYLKGTEYLAMRISKLVDAKVRAIVMDCTSQEEINLIADAIILSGIKFVAVDPGPFTATMARKVMRSGTISPDAILPRIFGMIGGNNPLIAAQVEKLRLEEKVLLVSVHNLELLADDEQRRSAEITRVTDELVTGLSNYKIAFTVSDSIGSTSKIQASMEMSRQAADRSETETLDVISAAYGQIAASVLARCPEIGAVYTTGAEFTVAVCRELKASGLQILGQVMPLTAYGQLLGGKYHGLKYITSASSATATDTVTESIQYLKRKLES